MILMEKPTFRKPTTILATLALGAFMGVTAQAGDIPEVTLQYANCPPPVLYLSKGDIFFLVEKFQRLTDGKVQMNMSHSSALGGPKEMFDLVGSGANEIDNFPASYQFSRLPISSTASNLPLVLPNDHIATIIDEAINEHPAVIAELDKNNLHPVFLRGLVPKAKDIYHWP